MNTKYIFAALVLIAALGVFGMLSLVFAYGIYQQHWDGGFVRGVARAFPIQAARLGDHKLLLRDYFNDVDSIQTYLSSQEAIDAGFNREITLFDRYSVIERSLEEFALLELAEQRNISITEEQISDYMQLAIDEFTQSDGRGQEDIEPYLLETYGWSIEDFKKHIIRPAVLDRTLRASYASDHGDDPYALDTYLQQRLTESDVFIRLQFPEEAKQAPVPVQ